MSSEELNPIIHRKTLVKTILEGQNDLTEDNYNIDLTSSVKEFSSHYVKNVLNAISEKFFEIERRLSTPKNNVCKNQSEDGETEENEESTKSIKEVEVYNNNRAVNLNHLGRMSNSDSASAGEFDKLSDDK